jgi:hypothetical protein
MQKMDHLFEDNFSYLQAKKMSRFLISHLNKFNFFY